MKHYVTLCSIVDGVFSATLRLLEDFDPALYDETSLQYDTLEGRVIEEVGQPDRIDAR